MRKLSQNGSGVVEVILILLVVGILGFTGWFVWHSKQNTDKTLNAASTTTTSKNNKSSASKSSEVTTTGNSLDIKEWGVKLGFTNSNLVTYSLESTPQADGSLAANLSLKPSFTAIADCQNLQVALIRSTTGPESTSVHKVGNYYYHIAGDPGPCSDPNGESGSITKVRNAILTTLGNGGYTIEADK